MITPREEPSRLQRRTYQTDYVRSLFDRIAPRYDILNHILSSGIDVLWRRRAIDLLVQVGPKEILDLATGTGDFAFECARLHPRQIRGVDISRAMMELARIKAEHRGLSGLVSFEEGAAEHLPFGDETFDAATIAFGVRNFSDLDLGLREVFRVLKPHGAFIVLEFSKPRASIVNTLYGFYSSRILPLVGGWISGSREAYSYLPETIRTFPDGEAFAGILRKTGFNSVRILPQTFGIATIYHAAKGTIG